jgi:hypothetical protein
MDSLIVACRRKKHFYLGAVTNYVDATCLIFNDNPAANSPFRVIEIKGKKIILAVDTITQASQIFLANKGFLKKKDTLTFEFLKGDYANRVKDKIKNEILLTKGVEGKIGFSFYICTPTHLYYFDNDLLVSDINTFHTNNKDLNFSFQISKDLYDDYEGLLGICMSDIQDSSINAYGFPFYFIDNKNYQLTTINCKGEEKQCH